MITRRRNVNHHFSLADAIRKCFIWVFFNIFLCLVFLWLCLIGYRPVHKRCHWNRSQFNKEREKDKKNSEAVCTTVETGLKNQGIMTWINGYFMWDLVNSFNWLTSGVNNKCFCSISSLCLNSSRCEDKTKRVYNRNCSVTVVLTMMDEKNRGRDIKNRLRIAAKINETLCKNFQKKWKLTWFS